MRRTLSNRILARHGSYYTGDFRLSEGMRKKLHASHVKGVRERFPMLDKLDFEHTWAGVFCMTRDWSSVFGRLEPGVYASLGYAGIGLPRGTISGKLLAEYALGGDSDLIADVQALSGPKSLPPEPFLGLGLKRACGACSTSAPRRSSTVPISSGTLRISAFGVKAEVIGGKEEVRACKN